MPKFCLRFPVQVALGALLIYGLTLCHGVSLNSLPLAAKIAGWDWIPMVGQPVLWLLTLPFRLLPGAWSPTGLNLFSALAGAATLGLLARSVELLPGIQTLQDWRSRLPLLLAAAVCGLELSFWQDATAATGEMPALLLLAAAIWCGLEHLATKRLRWLRAAAFFWGLGLAENWAMQITLPLFAVAMAWMLKKKVLQPKILLTLAGCGLAGFSAYALLPLANGLQPGSPWRFAAAWGHSIRDSKNLLAGIYGQFWVMNRMTAMTVTLFFLLPGLAVLLCFKNENPKNQSKLNRAIIWIFRGVRAGLLAFCLWLAFDPTFGPRQLMAREANLPLPLLTFDYLNALGIGFLTGNLLLIFQPRDKLRRRRNFSQNLVIRLERAALPVLTAVFVLVVLGLTARNLPAVTLSNRQPLTQFGDQLLRSLPPGGGIVVSDFPDKLAVLQASLAQHRDKSGWLPLDIAALPLPEYREHWKWLHGVSLPAATNGSALTPDDMLAVMRGLMQSNRVFYVHPSFGYFFEWFYQQPAGLVFEMQTIPADTYSAPKLTAEIIAQNEKVWDEFTPEIDALRQTGETRASSLVRTVEKKLFLERGVPNQIKLLREWYSLSLNTWGVQLQRNARLPEAQRRFEQALGLNANNWAARMNLFSNTNLQSGTAMSLSGVGTLTGQIGRLDYLKSIMSRWGPLDEPNACYLLGYGYDQSRLRRQAMQQFNRAHELAPEVLAPEFALAEIYSRCRLTNLAAATLKHLHEEIDPLPDATNGAVQLALLEAHIRSVQTNVVTHITNSPPGGL